MFVYSFVILKVFGLLLFCCSVSYGIDLPCDWIVYVEEQTSKFEASPWLPVCLPFMPIEENPATYINFVPDVILWDPMVQFPQSPALQICPSDCGRPLERKEWQNRQQSGSRPRIIHDIDGIVLLVSRTYMCASGHRFLSHDPQILEQFPCASQIPFVLSHKSGLTMRCVSMVLSLIAKGKKISTIESVLHQSRKENFFRKLLCASVNQNMHGFATFEETVAGKIRPGRELLLSCFLAVFWRNEIFYRQRTHGITINEDWICCDHTFKSAMNIGIYQKKTSSRAKWVKQFTALFLVLNDVGQALTWRLVEDTSYDSVAEVLDEVKQRLSDQKKVIREIYVDDCCKVRRKLQDIFGEQVMIKLDIFHAVQRITKKVSKKHSLFFDFISSLKLVFRNPSDMGPNREETTPDPTTLENNLDIFVKRWNGVKSDEGNFILTASVLQEINKLRVHIRNGCLSYIKKGRGTNRDESLHRSLNSFMKYSKIGTEVAYALLTTTIDNNNEQRETAEDKKRSFTEYATMQQINNNANNNDFHTPEFGLTNPRTNCDVPNLEEMMDDDMNDDMTDDQSTELLKKAKHLHDVTQQIKKQGIAKSVFNERYIPFMNSATSLFFHQQFDQSREDFEVHNMRVNAVVQGWGFRIIHTEGDGNCFFYSVSISLQHFFRENQNEAVLIRLRDMGISGDMTIQATAQRLRERVVQEWTSHQERYQPFLERSIEEESRLFLQSGYFMGELGNLMPLAMANLLGSPMIIFSSLVTMPVLLITPTSVTEGIPPVYLAFNQFGAGHYDAVNVEEEQSTPTAPLELGLGDNSISSDVGIEKCSCGKNTKRNSNKQQLCTDTKQYASRCPCLKRKNGCHSGCSCKLCKNPFGRNDKSGHSFSISDPTPRKRATHELSATRTNAREFMENMKARIRIEWNPTEIIIFECLIELLRNLNIAINAENIRKYFNKLVDKISDFKIGFEVEVVKKTMKEIQKRMESHDKALKAWLNAYFRKQIDENS